MAKLRSYWLGSQPLQSIYSWGYQVLICTKGFGLTLFHFGSNLQKKGTSSFTGQRRDLAFFSDLSQSENFSEIKPPLYHYHLIY